MTSTPSLSSPDRSESLVGVREWLKQLPSYGVDSVDCGSVLLDAPQITAVEKAVAETQVSHTAIRSTCTCIYM